MLGEAAEAEAEAGYLAVADEVCVIEKKVLPLDYALT